MSFEPVNQLETVLIKATMEVDARPEFYRVLAISDVFVIGSSSSKTKNGLIEAGEQVSIRNVEIDGKSYLAAFTSQEQLSKVISEETEFVRLRFSDLLNLVGDTEIALNPYLEYGKILVDWEVRGLRDGSLWKPQTTFTMKQNTQVTIGVPANPPKDFLVALAKYFETKVEVLTAFNLHYFNPVTDKVAHTLVCIESSGMNETMSAEIGLMASGSYIPDPPVDVMFITRDNGFGKTVFKDFKPFYQKKTGFWKDIFKK
jgi:hypothetical protein